ncbi:MAG TPA: B12-binding domain-containing radical SAM protein [Bacteroidales bacterium]|nr:B12-binding domain-containing radical SAM protein [Bacteroidales bacterium]
MNILLVYPENPDTFWSFKHALRFTNKKSSIPPLGLITVSSILPKNWNKRLIDLNVTKLKHSDIIWADYVFISGMYVQTESANDIIAECKKYNVKIVGGGPLFTQNYNHYSHIDHLVLNEAEVTLSMFINDIESGKTPQRIYRSDEYADMTKTPVPDFGLLSMKDYVGMNIQVARGCPFACDFCEITSLLGHKVRMKDTSQVIAELDALYKLNWRGIVSIVDDNFIGNKKQVKTDLLPAMISWMKEHNHPFSFNTQTSIDLADDKELMEMMIEAGFFSAFIGIETPDEQGLEDCNKVQNRNRNLLESVKKIQKAGFQVTGGFIVGFDSDSPTVFERQVEFIQESGIVSALVGMLNAPKNTRLYDRLEAENRILADATGNTTDSTINFIPKMDISELMKGYNNIIHGIYSTKPYYKRARMFLKDQKVPHKRNKKFEPSIIFGFIKSVIVIGIIKRGRREYWKFIAWTLFRRPNLFVNAATLTVFGYHYRTVFKIRK